MKDEPVKNARLIDAMRRAGLSIPQLARQVFVNPKTVSNWTNGRATPRREVQMKIVELLGCEIHDIWPNQAQPKNYALSEVVNLWVHRSDTSKDLWLGLLESANEHVDLLGIDTRFLMEDHAMVVRQLLLRKAREGCEVRIILPTEEMMEDHDRMLRNEFKVYTSNLSRVTDVFDSSITGMSPAARKPEVRFLSSHISYSMSRFDDDLLLRVDLFNQQGRLAPVLQLHSGRGDGLFAACTEGFDNLFSQSVPNS